MRGFVQFAPIAVVGIIFIAIAYLSVYGFQGLPGGALSGFTTIGLGSATFTSSSPFFSGEQYILTVVQGGLAQHAEGTISASAIESATGEDTGKSIKIEIDYAEQSCDYAIRKTSDYPVYTFQIVEQSFTLPVDCCTWAHEDFESKGGTGGTGGCGTYAYTVPWTCWYARPVLITSAVSYEGIEAPFTRTVSDISVTVDGVRDTFSMDTQADSRGPIGNYAYVVHNGDLLKSSCPSISAYYGFYKQGGWKLGSKALYQTYRNAVEDADIDVLETDGNRFAIKAIYDRINSAATAATAIYTFGTVSSPSSMDGAVVVRAVDSFATLPLYTFYVKADKLQVSTPAPNMFISSASVSTFKTAGTVNVKVRNDGDTANAQVWVDCPPPFGDSVQKSSVVQTGTVKNFYLDISANVAAQTTVTCTAYVNDGLHTRNLGFFATASPEKTCDANKKECTASGQIRLCNADGSAWVILQTCGVNQVCDYQEGGEPYCKDVGGPVDGECAPFDIFCALGLNDFGGMFGAIIAKAVIAAIIAAVIMGVIFFIPYARLIYMLPQAAVIAYLLIFVVILAVTL